MVLSFKFRVRLGHVLAWEAGVSSSANVHHAAYGRSSSLISLRYSPQPPKLLSSVFIHGLKIHAANKIMSMRCLAQRHQGGAVAIGDVGDSRGAKYHFGVIPTNA